MNSSAKKYFLIVTIILVIFGVTAKLYVNFSKFPLLKSTQKLVKINKDFSKLDSCIFKLYEAENSCRLFVVSGERKYFQQFTDEIKSVKVTMDSIEVANQNEKAFSSESFNNLIAQKKIRTAQFIRLKLLADSLINFSITIDKVVEKMKPMREISTTKEVASVVQIDTIRPEIVVQKKKKFFGRLIDAINNKSEVGRDSSKTTKIKKTVASVTSSERKAVGASHFKEINNYYKKIYSTTQKAKEKEKELLEVNHKLILSVVDGLKIYKSKESNYYKSVEESANSYTYDALKNLDTFNLILIIVVAGLLLLLFYVIYRIYKHEKLLVDQNKKASLYAVSKGRFLANMSHEIRTPLNSIVGLSEQLGQVNLDAHQKEQILAIKNSSLLLLDVVNDILDFSKYETGKFTLDAVPFSPLHIINDVFDSMKIQATEKNIAFINNIKIDENLYVLGDPLRLKQVIMNLLNNAIKFTYEGSVTLVGGIVRSLANNAVLKVSITDTGMGIKETDQRIIFDEFAQVYYSSTKAKQQGTGLGLSICKKIIDFHGGSITVNSEEDRGSVFSFELPYQITKKDVADRLRIKPTPNTGLLKDKKVLLADDNMLNILLASTILKKYHVLFDVANNGNEAWALFETNRYDMVLTDIQMPEMGGVELTKKIRATEDKSKAYVPVLGITANVMPEDRKNYLDSGMNELVLKPFLEHELIDKIIKFLK